MAKIIVAEDDKISRQIIVRLIESLGHVAIQCSDGLRAYYVLQDNPDAAMLVTDMVMPHLTGRELIEKIRHDAQRPMIPILIVSGAIGPKAIRDLLEAGATAFLGKPIDGHLLKEYVKENIEA